MILMTVLSHQNDTNKKIITAFYYCAWNGDDAYDSILLTKTFFNHFLCIV